MTASAPTPSPARRTVASRINPLRELIGHGRMPVTLELHLTEADRDACLRLRQRYIARGYELPTLIILGEYLRHAEADSAEYTPGERSLVRKLQVYADLLCSGRVDLVALDDGARGRDTLDNASAAELLVGLGADPARLMINMVARNRVAEQIRLRLLRFATIGVRNVLLLTGDLPIDAGKTARFPLDAVGMLKLARRMQIDGELPDDFWLAAAGHPNPDADPDGTRTLQKALAGARVIVTQAIYSVEQFADWMGAIQRQGALDMVHVLAEIAPITSPSQLRAIAEVPGMRVPTSLIQQLELAQRRIDEECAVGGLSPDVARHRRLREGQRVTRDLLHRLRAVPGVSGFYLGCVKGFEPHLELLKETPLVPPQVDGLHKHDKISGAERQLAFAELSGISEFLKRLVARTSRPQGPFRRLVRRLSAVTWIEDVLKLIEWPKVPAFGCHKCDQCDLSADALVCPRGCAKQMSHGPCGAPRLVNGRMLCEDTSRECTWAAIRARRDQYGVGMAERLSAKPAPSAEFYAGKAYSAVLPVLQGRRSGPNWSLAWRVPWAHLVSIARPRFQFAAEGSSRSLVTLAESLEYQLRELLEAKPDPHPDEMLLKTLALIGTPAAMHLFEARLVERGLPAEGTLHELSPRELFRLADAYPKTESPLTSGASGPALLLEVVAEGRQLRRAMRRELADRIIRHIAALGYSVSYSGTLLETRQVEDLLAALSLLKDELQSLSQRRPADAEPIAVQFHRVHYRHHFHPPIGVQTVIDGDAPPRVLLRVDMKQFESPARFRLNLRAALADLAEGETARSEHKVLLEQFVPAPKSVAWAFNAEFWSRLRDFESAIGVAYDASIGGSTDHNLGYARAAARALYDRMTTHDVPSESVCILEIGVASTHRARTFVAELARLNDLDGRSADVRPTYLLADFSETILQRAAADLATVHPRIETVRIDASDPHAALASFAGRVIHAHLCNVFDNLPAEHVFRQGDRWYRTHTRAYVELDMLTEISRRHGLTEEDDRQLRGMLTGLGDDPHRSPGWLLESARQRLMARGREPLAYVRWWVDLFAALRFDERHARIDDPVELLREHIPRLATWNEVRRSLDAFPSDVRFHLNAAALRGFVELASLLHPQGTLEVIDLFVQRPDEYEHAFKGPAKYDGTIVNWLNGPLFRAIADELHFDVRFQPFRPFDAKSVSVVVVANPRQPA